MAGDDTRALIVMLSRDLGGIQQAALDQAEMLALAGLPAMMALSRGAALAPMSLAAGREMICIRQAGSYDYLAAWRLRAAARAFNADVVLCHGARALQLMLKARPGKARLVAMAHNYDKAEYWARADAVIAVTPDIARHAVSRGAREDRVHVVPNAIDVPAAAPRRVLGRTPPVIGALGRFVEKKGFHVLLDALALLNARGVAYEAIIGGDGEENAALRARAERLGLGRRVTFPGWVRDRREFFSVIDLFCVPSLHEPFGIVLLEAFANGAPVVATRSEGPSQILSEETGSLVALNDASALADALAAALVDPARAGLRAEAAFLRAQEMYAKSAVAAQLARTLRAIA